MLPDYPGLHQSDGHLVPQADTCGQPLRFIDAARVQTIQVAVPSLRSPLRRPPPPPFQESKPNVHDDPVKTRVLLEAYMRTGHRTPVLGYTKYSQKTGKPENRGASRGCAKYVNLLTK